MTNKENGVMRTIERIAMVMVLMAATGVLPRFVNPARAGSEPAMESAGDHRALAEQYAGEAAELRRKAEEHKAMLEAYKRGPQFEKLRKGGNLMARHCQELIDEYTEGAEKAEALAESHANMAAEMEGSGVSAWSVGHAKDAAQHNAIAEQFTQEAKRLRQKAEEHKGMLQAYEKGPKFEKARKEGGLMGRHCREPIDSYTKAAEEAQAMAKQHRELAGSGR
jgi:hypothetical protein